MGCGFNPVLVIQKTIKIAPGCLTAWHDSGLDLVGLGHPMSMELLLLSATSWDGSHAKDKSKGWRLIGLKRWRFRSRLQLPTCQIVPRPDWTLKGYLKHFGIPRRYWKALYANEVQTCDVTARSPSSHMKNEWNQLMPRECHQRNELSDWPTLLLPFC